MTPERCERCDKPRATRADYDSTAEGEGGHLCWAEWGSSCMLHDWRREALSLRIRAEASMRERDEARAERDEALRRLGPTDSHPGLAWQALNRERDEARAQLATLREAATPIYDRDLSADERRAWWDRLERTLADIEAAARAHDARIRAAALRKAAERIESTPPTLLASASDWQRWLCEMADEAEKESR